MHKLHSVCLHYDPPVSPVTSPSRDAINLVNESISLTKNTAGRRNDRQNQWSGDHSHGRPDDDLQS